ncbi:MAG: glycosyltransferase family 2 protein [Flavobacteriales bacterium]|nr:MAG: glycosyltransferase family 2 protein [Flavobacteriales bacterium]
MKLSVIIVNYNVKAYLEQCLRTVFTALDGIEGDVFVVDNLSTDGSVEMVKEKFPQVRLIANAENVGFSRANNQAIRASRSEYVVLLNPDTVVGEDVFHKVIGFLDAHPTAGGLGVKMIDGKGRFLPESKRGLPTPAVAFYKIIGLTRLFPRSRVFGRYHLGHLPENERARIEILSGACMFLRRRTLDEVGLLDESFFMYGEDIDLSYRITLGGYENWYLPEARIIHYKGESTKKSSVNYVFVFYNAMAIFAKKHFTRRRTDLLSLLITGSIYLSAAAAIVTRFLSRALLPMLDVLLLWAFALAFGHSGLAAPQVPERLAAWTLLMVACLGLAGAYDRPVKLLNLLKGSLLFAAVVLLWLALNGEPSDPGRWRGLPALLQVVPVVAAGLASRTALSLLRVKGYGLRDRERQRVLAIGSAQEARRALALLWQTHYGLGRQLQMTAAEALDEGALKAIKRTIRRQGVDEVVFCAQDLPYRRIIDLMEGLKRAGAMFKVAQPDGEFIIGPSSIESLADMDVLEEHAVSSAAGKRAKRLLDTALSLTLLAGLPIAWLLVKDRIGLVRNAWRVLLGRRSWVGYRQGGHRVLRLPAIRPGVLDTLTGTSLNSELAVQRANVEYAKDYSPWRDLRLVIRGFSHLGRA